MLITKIIAFSANNRWLVIFMTIALVAIAISLFKHIRLDALPDLSDTQVIVYSRWDRSPDIIEDQVTYPIISSLLGAPKIKSIRGLSDFGYSFVYVIFKDGTDLYWARSRVMEYLSKISQNIPEGVKTEIGPDATAVGWIFQYALIDKSHRLSIEELRTIQDWILKYAFLSVPGVAEVATIGGFVKQYQIIIDPHKLLAFNVPLETVVNAIHQSNNESGARLLEWSETEYMVRIRGYANSIQDFENVVIKVTQEGFPILLKHIARVEIGPEMRRGVADLDGLGDTVGGIIIMREGENALNVIKRVKEKISNLKMSLPEGVEIIPTYDRSELIYRALETLKHELIIEIIIVSLVILIFLWHIPSAIVPILTIPISVLLSFIPLYLLGITINIMSLAGIAISIGVLVDGAIVEVENAYNKIYRWLNSGRKGNFHQIRLEALQEVGPSVFYSLMVIAVAFLPIFTLIDQEGRLFKPLAYSKNLAMAVAALMAITLDPAVRMFFSRISPFSFRPRWLAKWASKIAVGTYYSEEKHPITRLIAGIYEPVCRVILSHPLVVILASSILIGISIPIYFQLGSEFMPPLNEGTILYMPTTLPGISIAQVQELLIAQDRILSSFEEVERVFGKAGRAETSTDPAPLSMIETTIVLKQDSQWRAKPRWYSNWLPEVFKPLVRPIWPDRIQWEELIEEMDKAMKFPGVSNAWTMPIKARIDMLTTGIRTPVGIKIYGDNVKLIENIGIELEKVLREIPETRSVYAERISGGYFVDLVPDRLRMSRYGLTVEQVQMIISAAIGGENITTTFEGRARYPVNLRYPRELRDDLENLGKVLIDTPSGIQIPLSQVVNIQIVQGPSMLRDENGFLTAYVYIDVAGRDINGYVNKAKKLVQEKVQIPAGYILHWSGQFENMMRVRERLKLILPITLLLIFLLLYLNTHSGFKALLVMLAVPFSAIGAIWLFWILDYNLSIAAWVGVIALMGLDAETGVFMLLFLDLSYEEAKKNGRLKSLKELDEAIIYGAVKRARPKLMTVSATFMGLLPIMWSTSAGADIMKRIAAPMIGGLFTSFLLELLVYPAIYKIWKRNTELKNLPIRERN